MKTVYKWKVLSEDGLLKEPEDIRNSNHLEINLNGFEGGFSSESLAHAHLTEVVSKVVDFNLPYEIVLVKIIKLR